MFEYACGSFDCAVDWHGAPEPNTRFSIGATGRKELISLAACVNWSICEVEIKDKNLTPPLVEA